MLDLNDRDLLYGQFAQELVQLSSSRSIFFGRAQGEFIGVSC
ncbi:hypothetical protein [Prochlorothrix hollandica]|nr:hypothetical protein [Prochlorothrix hollandica]